MNESERGWRTRDKESGHRAAGFRTFALMGLAGGVTGLIALKVPGIFAGIVFACFTAAFTAFHWLEAKANANSSVTSVIAGLLTFLLGIVAVIGETHIAIACGVAMTCLLALREWIHSWIAALQWKELRAVLVLLAMSFLLLPFLPNKTN